jgi:hypothetical protein
MVTPVAIETIGFKYYIVFAVIAGTVAPVVYFLYPETMGHTLEEIDLMFINSPSAWSTVKYARSHPITLPSHQELEAARKHDEKATHIERDD